MNDDRPYQPTAEQKSLLGKFMRFCLTNKLVIVLVLLMVTGWGIMVAPFDWQIDWLPRDPVPVDAIPDIGENQQIVFTEWMGRSPQDVEDQITYPLTVSLLGVPGVETIRSSSFFGFSSIYVIFKDGVDFYWSRSRILEKLSSLPAGTMPAGAQPTLGPDATGLGQIFWYTLEGRDPEGKPLGGWDLEELRTIQDWLVRYALMGAEGVSEVASVGGFVREYQVDVDPDAMRAYNVGLGDVYEAVKASNIDVGARSVELNRVEYFIRSVGFIKDVADIENSVVKVVDNVPVLVKHIATVSVGPAQRRGALDKEGAEAVGGVVVARYGDNPLAVIKNVKDKIAELSPGLPAKVVIDYGQVTPQELRQFAQGRGFEAYAGAELNREGWLDFLRGLPQQDWPGWANISKVEIAPFYDRTDLIYETLGTLQAALTEEILVTVIVVILMVMHLRSSILIGGLLPIAVLMCFIAMKTFGVDANIVALSGIAIAIGTMVDMGIVICENILRHLDEADPEIPRLEVVHRGASEVGSAVLTAVFTTVISFLPVFTMTGADGKLFKPLAFTKTFALIASIIVALSIIPPAAHILFCGKVSGKKLRLMLHAGVALVGVVTGFLLSWWAGIVLMALGGYYLLENFIPPHLRRFAPWISNAIAVLFLGVLLTQHWEPLGVERGIMRNLTFVGLLMGGLLGFFYLFQLAYPMILRWCLAHKTIFLLLPVFLLVFGAAAWVGPQAIWGEIPDEGFIDPENFSVPADYTRLAGAGLIVPSTKTPQRNVWATQGINVRSFSATLKDLNIEDAGDAKATWLSTQSLSELSGRHWDDPKYPDYIAYEGLGVKARWTLARGWNGLGKESRPPLDEGSFLFMPSTSFHASIGEAMDVLSKQDMAIRSIWEIDSVVGKIGRAETPLDPAPVSMTETVVNYKPEYITDKAGRRVLFEYDKSAGEFIRDEQGELIPDPHGLPYRQWRPEIQSPDDIWDEILHVTQIPGSTSAPKLQPISTRLLMLQSGMKTPMGVKIKGPSLEAIDKVALQIERLLRDAPGVDPTFVVADRMVGKPYLEIVPDREAIGRYGIPIRVFQDVVEIAIGGREITSTVEGRERFGVRVRYQRELRDQIETMERILIPGAEGAQIPLTQLAEIRYVRGPQRIKSEDTFLVGNVLFNSKAGYAPIDVVEACQSYLQEKIDSGELVLGAGVSFAFSGEYEQHVRSQKTLRIVLPVALFVIFLILYFQFKSTLTSLLVFSGIFVAWAGGFLLLWLYGQPWFLNFEVFGVDMRGLFQVHPINLSVAVWVGFLALFGIASDDGVIISTYLEQVFRERKPDSIAAIREATLTAGCRRVRPCLMTVATTILALIPVLTSSGRGADVMVPMAIPTVGGMTIALITIFVVPVLYAAIAETKLRWGKSV